MLAVRKVPSATNAEAALSSSSTRASSPVTQDSPAPSSRAHSDRDAKLHNPGDVVNGRYVLVEQLGKGGMGVVWKARSTALDVEVAVKLMRSAKPNPEASKRMAREAHAAARLGHPAMATVLDFGATPEGDPYVVMELLHGESLGEVLGRERRVDVLRAVGTLLPIMDGLREAHDKGIVHRDLKPENLFISKTARGRLQPKVLDFGIAKLEQPMDSTTKLTQDGAVLGSPGYFSPEQARGETDIDFRTDIWSISVVLYELITGELPFSGANYNALLMSILKDTPPSILSHGYGDEELWQILQKGLHRDREQRWGSMWELGRALAAWLYDKGVRADVASRSLKEVWLEARSESEHAPPPEGFGREDARRRVQSTLIQRRAAADTLAGETLSAQPSQLRLPTRLLGWGAVAASVSVIVWGALTQAGARPVAQAASATGPATQLEAAEPISAGVPLLTVVPRAAAASGSADAVPVPVKDTSKPARWVPSTRPGARATLVTPKLVDASARTRLATQNPPARAKSARATPRKSIDKEFGF
jgi:serine/threonine protein kinase